MIKSRSIPDVCCSMVQRYEKYFFMYHICTIFRLSMHQAPTEVFICALLSLYFAGEETKSVEREHTIQELQKHNEELQETVNLNKGSMSFMTNYINELEKLIIDDDVDFYY